MRRALILLLILAGLLGAAGAAVAAPAAARTPPAPAIGIGEQSPDVFAHADFARLGLRDMRFVAAWDALRSPWQRAELDRWMAAAENQGARVLLGFGHSRVKGQEDTLPSAGRFRREFLRFRARYPLVKGYLVWNEGNHSSQPTWRNPKRAAAYFDVVARDCRGCAIVAADVLDWPNMTSWLRAFRRHARERPRIWGLHNYLDANRFQTTGTRQLLRAVRGEVWFTETGGLVERRQMIRGRLKTYRHSTRHAARATEWVIRLAALSPRVKRVYLYHWKPGAPSNRWDSALIDRRGRPRAAYDVVRRWAERTKAARRRR